MSADATVLCLSGRKVYAAIRLPADQLEKRLQADLQKHRQRKNHPTYHELMAQVAVLKHVQRHEQNVELFNDHWSRTLYASTDLLREGIGALECPECGQWIDAELLTHEDWADRSMGEGFMTGGSLFRCPRGHVSLRIVTRMS